MSDLTPDDTFKLLVLISVLVAITAWAYIAGWRYAIREREKTFRYNAATAAGITPDEEDEDDADEVTMDTGPHRYPVADPAKMRHVPAIGTTEVRSDDGTTRHIRGRDPVIGIHDEGHPDSRPVERMDYTKPRPIRDNPQA